MSKRKQLNKRVNGAWHCTDCDSVIHSKIKQVCLTCNSKNMEPAIVEDLYNADEKNAKFRSMLDLPVISEEERRVNKQKNSLEYYKQWKKHKKS